MTTQDWHFVTPQLPVKDVHDRGAEIVEDIASHPWGMREFAVADDNGHRFRLGHSEGPVVPPEGRGQGR